MDVDRIENLEQKQRTSASERRTSEGGRVFRREGEGWQSVYLVPSWNT